ncbi:serine hydroxymethyltransferase [Candidatus Saccharibacteria bacterium CG10_big_fil_rev_8_21_14_0_10_47_8]|nr:MAG: serine hydroxymethyltransferase [Candidatus Saccharibacteria bacterium CG10_big_fil_rev_8_21_14_0_10_47_8]
MNDKDIYKLILAEHNRQSHNLQMIPSENHASADVFKALGSILTDKYSEGYPGQRYYGGCEVVDKVENLARDRAKALFGVSHANVQPYSGSPANSEVYMALLDPGDTIMGLALSFGGHLTHGHKVSASGIFYRSVQYETGSDGYLDYDVIAKMAQKEKPKILVVGATAYPRIFDWQRLRVIVDSVGAWMLADVSHIAGLIVAGEHPSPVGIADVVMTTTHKTLRGPRGAMILCSGKPSTPLKKVERIKENLPTLIDRAVFPGMQGGPHNHQTAAIAVALREAAQPDFKIYARQIVSNAKKLALELKARGFELVTGGTDNHLLLVDLTNIGVSGKEAEDALNKVGITVNKNTVPFDPRGPFDPSGIRLGTPAVTSRGLKEDDMTTVAEWILQAIKGRADNKKLDLLSNEVKKFALRFPLPSDQKV